MKPPDFHAFIFLVQTLNETNICETTFVLIEVCIILYFKMFFVFWYGINLLMSSKNEITALKEAVVTNFRMPLNKMFDDSSIP
jgi:hypothetical protein